MINKIYLGDCLDIIDKIPDNSIDLIVTDPPYIYNMNGGDGFLRKRDKYNKKSKLRNIIDGFNIDLHFTKWKRILKKFNVFIFCSNKQISTIMKWGEDNNYITTLLVWHKTNASPFSNGVWKSDLEFCVHIREKGATFQGKSKDKSKIYISPTEKNKYGHPTEKPLQLIKKYIKLGSNERDVILDPFLGSGTTVNACIDLNRQYIGVEIDEQYYKIAKNREQRAIGNIGLFKNPSIY